MGQLIGLFVLVIVLLGSGAYLRTNPEWLQKYRTSPSSTMVPQTTSVPAQDSQIENTTSWQTYTGQSGRFTFSIPSNWRFSSDTPGCGPVWFSPSSQKIWLTVCGPYPQTAGNPQTLAKTAAPNQTVNQQTITLTGHSAVRQDFPIEGGNTTQVFVADVKSTSSNETGTLAIYFTNLEPGTSPDPSFNQILNTFSFQ